MAKSLNDEDETEKVEVTHTSLMAPPNLDGDWLNFFLLIALYTMQGMTLGVAIAIPFLLQAKKDVSYGDQAFFSLVAWPYSFKLLWAPIVDSVYIQRIGRRKSWLVPVQYLMGAFLFYTATKIDIWLPDVGMPNFKALVYAFCTVSFLAATQDIVVDGWALTMLKKNNAGHASTCNGTGIALGVLIGSIGPTLLTSDDFCSKYLWTNPGTGGLITIKGFLYFWSILFVVLTTLVGIFKTEKNSNLENDYIKINVAQNYKLLWDIIKLPTVRTLSIALLTMKIGFSATDVASNLKLIDAGIPKDNILIMKTSMYLVKFILPFVVSKYTSGPKPMSAYFTMMPFRLLWSISYVVLIYYTPYMIKKDDVDQVPSYYYVVLGLISTIHEIMTYSMFIFTMGFFSRISDSRYGGTYMTLLSTISYFGWVASNTFALKMVDVLTFSKCSNDAQNKCSTKVLKDMCIKTNGNCVTTVNGYYIEVCLCMIIGTIWYFYFKKPITKLQSKSRSNWLVKFNQTDVENDQDF